MSPTWILSVENYVLVPEIIIFFPLKIVHSSLMNCRRFPQGNFETKITMIMEFTENLSQLFFYGLFMPIVSLVLYTRPGLGVLISLC
jgi:hypothetical protein